MNNNSSNVQPSQNALPYAAPTLVPLGDVRMFTLGSSSNDTADKKKYYN